MKSLRILLISVFILPLASFARTPARSRTGLPRELVELAARAKSSRTWPQLRRYAATRRSARDRALAYFTLGYREYEADQYEAAEKDLAKASSAESPVADLAVYYRASAAYRDGHPELVEGILGNFSRQYPASTEHYAAIELRAWAFLQNGETQKALHLLLGKPEVLQRPAMALVLAQAYTDNGQLRQAAQIFQDLYYAFPATPQAKAAGDALGRLKSQLGVNYPPVTDEIATARVERLYTTYHYSQALKGYEELLRNRQKSHWAWQWNLGRAQCLIRLGHSDDAIDTLVNSVAPTPALDAERLATLVDAYARTDNDVAIAKAINNLRANHFTSHWHAVALLRAATYFMDRGEWDIAPLYYRTLLEAFPKTPQASLASWRLAWIAYLTGTPSQARKLLLSHIQNYPDSPFIPASFYFLGRLEEHNQPGKARALYDFLEKRYRHSYYAFEAARRLSVLRKSHAEISSEGGAGFSLAQLTSKIPAADPPDFGACLPSGNARELAAFRTLAALHLDGLAKQDATYRLKKHPNSPALVVALSRLEIEQGRPDLALHTAMKIVPDYYSQQFSELPREIWQLLYPSPYNRIIRRYAAINRLNPYLVMGLIRQESGFNRHATSPSNARGLMQVMASTVTRSPRYRRSVRFRLYSPTYNVRFGCAYLRDLVRHYHGNIAEAVAAYNAGPTRVDQWISKRTYRNQQDFVESIPFPGTRVYVKAVIADSGVYRDLMKRTTRFGVCSTRSTRLRRRSATRLHRYRRRRVR